MPDVMDILRERASLIGEAVSSYTDDPNWVWGWSGGQYQISRDGLLGGNEYSRPTELWYWRPGGGRNAVYLDLVRPMPDVKGLTESTAVPLGEGYVQWAEEGSYKNPNARTPDVERQIREGLLPNDFDFLDYTFTAHFAATQSWEESKEIGFREAISNTFSVEIGGDVYGGKVGNQTTAEFESTQTSGSSEGGDEEAGDEESFSIRIAPGQERRITAKRTVLPMKYIITGWGDLEHAVHIGQRPGHNRWASRKGKGGRIFHKSLHWDSFADFLKVVKATATAICRLGSGSRITP